MFTTVIIQASPERSPYIRALSADTGLLQLVREFPSVPGHYELTRIVNASAPDLVLIDVGSGDVALRCCATIRDLDPEMPVLALACPPGLMQKAKDAGFTAVLPESFTTADLAEAIHTSLVSMRGGVEDYVFSFLPSKAGSGASTVVLNTAMALARDHGKRVLVIDADLRSSVLGILLDVKPTISIQHLLTSTNDIDQFRLRSAAVTVDGVDFLLSSRSLDTVQPEWPNYFQLLEFVRDKYDTILVDLPELVNPATIELVRRSRKVYMVCTTEVPSLRLTQQRAEELHRWGLPPTRYGLLVNRWHNGDPSSPEIAKILGLPVLRQLPNDYATIRKTQTEGRFVPVNTRLGKAFADFASVLAGDASVPLPKPTSRLMSLFGR
ncbi:AAA family ATPase [uncultured Paludibaculum sp.]|uniref:AAA family ATPase n=1 Tax=uncultured Paludibaculum sp. TaxID=1765020 RepID=UPI002AAB9ED4|nr:AAA family ATPase [uncultured Paludibaculum sp.]